MFRLLDTVPGAAGSVIRAISFMLRG